MIIRLEDILTYLLVIASTISSVNTATCDRSATECEFWLVVDYKLTMMDDRDGVVAKSGRLYHIDDGSEVTNYDNVVTTDGYNVSRLVIAVNGTVPGPAIQVYDGQTVTVHVTNNLPSQATSLHWHGLHQRGSPWSDGVAFVSQCPIEPGQSFTHRFKANPTGTFFYHSHIGLQRTMGLFGPLIVYERDEKPEFQHTLMLNDWNHDSTSDEDYFKFLYGLYTDGKRHRTTKSLDGATFSMFDFQSGLINGKGRIEYPDGTNNGAPLHVFNVKEGKTYRFRLINSGKQFPFRISFDSHTIVVIGTDGFPLDPEPAESIILHPGERFDIQIITANRKRTSYWVRAKTLEVGVNHTALAILRYEGADPSEPVSKPLECFQSNPCIVINCPFKYFPVDEYKNCITLDELKAPLANGAETVRDDTNLEERFLNFAFPGRRGIRPGSVNGRAFVLPPVSALTQPQELGEYTCDKQDCGEQKVCTCMNSLSLEHNKVYQLIFLNMGRGRGFSHPIHMHGHAFYVMKMGYGDYSNQTGRQISDNADIDCGGGRNVSQRQSFCNQAQWKNNSWFGNNIPGIDLNTPPRKDTVIVPTGGYVVVRIKADNPGLWYMHCHIELHNRKGMAMVLNESFPQQELDKVPPGFPRCGHFRLPASGAAGVGVFPVLLMTSLLLILSSLSSLQR